MKKSLHTFPNIQEREKKFILLTISIVMLYQYKGTSKINVFLRGIFNPFCTYDSLGTIIIASQNIIKILNDISLNTNLLSLNAAIEAARAGKAGMGFAVITDEILKIADRTNESLKNIRLPISSNDKAINIGKDNAAKTIDTISSMLTGINTISTIMDKISGHINKQPDANNLIKKTGNLKI